jgi:hypothetical protein
MTIFIWFTIVILTLPQRNKSAASRTVRNVKGFVAYIEGKTTIKPLAKIIHGKKKLNFPITMLLYPEIAIIYLI